jgi:putative thioredoxin
MTSIAAESSDFCTLATIDIARNAMIARQLEIQQLPTIMLFQNGRPVDGITGDANEAQIRELLGRYLPKSWDLQLNTAQQLLAQQQFSEALPLLRSAYNDSQERADIGLHLAQAFLGLNRIDEADSLLQKTRLADQDWLYQQLHSQIQLKRTAAKTPELETLEQALAHNPDDLGIQMQLAIQYQQESMHRQALELLLSILKKDKQFNNGQAKSIMLDMFKSLGTQDPLVIEFQRQLFAILY